MSIYAIKLFGKLSKIQKLENYERVGVKIWNDEM